jgi:DNA invertase Pin-like site-specific DNA recombinase
MLGVFAELVRSIIQERVNAGMERARIHGTKSGKPIGQRPLSQAKVEAIQAELARGTGILKTARLCGTGVSAMQRIKRARLPRKNRTREAAEGCRVFVVRLKDWHRDTGESDIAHVAAIGIW